MVSFVSPAGKCSCPDALSGALKRKVCPRHSRATPSKYECPWSTRSVKALPLGPVAPIPAGWGTHGRLQTARGWPFTVPIDTTKQTDETRTRNPRRMWARNTCLWVIFTSECITDVYMSVRMFPSLKLLNRCRWNLVRDCGVYTKLCHVNLLFCWYSSNIQWTQNNSGWSVGGRYRKTAQR